VVVSSPGGSVTNNPPARLYVVPNTPYTKGNFTNQVGLRLPYFYRLPTNYDPAGSYPLIVYFHGTPGDENIVPSGYFPSYPAYHVFSSFRQQSTDPAIVVWPCRRAGDSSWTDLYVTQAAALMDDLISRLAVDTNRVYASGGSEGVHAVWDLIGLRPGLFAGARLSAGWQGSTPVSSFAHIPIWATCSAQDDELANMRSLVEALRRNGRDALYTEYASGAHLDTIAQGWCTPAMADWLLALRRGQPSTNQPCLQISPPQQETFVTAATQLRLSGSASAEGQAVTKVTWENTANAAKGTALGTNLWNIPNLPLQPELTNLVVVTGVTTSWAPLYGGTTTFNNSVSVLSSPIRVTLRAQGSALTLSWVGGAPPFQIQRTTNLSDGVWETFVTNASAPVMTTQDVYYAAFYRVACH